jgi:hypothetical protein
LVRHFLTRSALAENGNRRGVLPKLTLVQPRVQPPHFQQLAVRSLLYNAAVVPAGDYTITTNWPGTSDIDAILCVDAACSDRAFAGTGLTQPEVGTLTLTPGTY